jgi:geranylgeranyl diphosphate synthase, type II
VEKTLALFHECGVDKWATDLKEQYLNNALQHLEDMAVLSTRKEPLKELALFLVKREY